jgi:hypothetical protein
LARKAACDDVHPVFPAVAVERGDVAPNRKGVKVFLVLLAFQNRLAERGYFHRDNRTSEVAEAQNPAAYSGE